MTEREYNKLKQLETEGYFTCFRTGVWEDSSEKKHNITQGDLDTIAQKFEARGTIIPLTISHFGKAQEGKIEKIIRYGDYLLAKAREVTESLKEKIQNGVKRFVSIAFNKDMELDHIAVTNEPQVDGLLPLTPAMANFSKEGIIFHFSKPTINQLEIEIKEVQMPEEKVTASPPGDNLAEFAAVKEKLSAAEKEKADALKKAQDAETKLAEFAKKQKEEGISTFTAQLVKDGKLFPVEVEGMNLLLNQLDEVKLHQFSKDTQKTQTQFIKDFLTELPKRIPLDKIETGSGKKPTGDNACFSRITPDEEDLDMHQKALEISQKENIPYQAALARLDGER